MTIVIGGAWPYANGSLHLGHVAALLPGDILARYYRQKVNKYYTYRVVTVMVHQFLFVQLRKTQQPRRLLIIIMKNLQNVLIS